MTRTGRHHFAILALAAAVLVLRTGAKAQATPVPHPAAKSASQPGSSAGNNNDDSDDADGDEDTPAASTGTANASAGISAPKVNREGTGNDRIFGLLPNFETVEIARKLPPMTPGEKFALAADGTFDRVELAFVGVLAGINQYDHENPSWHYGLAGYGRRYAEAFANQAIENFVVNAALPSLLHQDPRYYQMARGGVTRRALYAASRIVVTRSDDGALQINTSEIGGSLAAAAASNLYEPRESRTVGNTAEIWGTQVLIDAMSNELREFWPDLKHHVFRRR